MAVPKNALAGTSVMRPPIRDLQETQQAGGMEQAGQSRAVARVNTGTAAYMSVSERNDLRKSVGMSEMKVSMAKLVGKPSVAGFCNSGKRATAPRSPYI